MKKTRLQGLFEQAQKGDSIPAELNDKPAEITRRQFTALATSLSASALLSGVTDAAQSAPAASASARPHATETGHAPTEQALSPAPEFIPDWIFKGSSLSDWHTLGAATWKAENGVITGTPNGGGWLFLNRSFQDVQFFMRMKCAGDCNAGVLLRAEKTEDGMKGMYVALKAGDLEAHRVTLDTAGKELTRESMPQTWGTIRVGTPDLQGGGGAGGRGGAAAGAPGGRGGAAGPAGPAGPAAPAGAAGAGGAGGAAGGRGRGGGLAAGNGPGDFMQGVNLPTPLPGLMPPPKGLSKTDWDQIQIIYDADIVRPYLNNTNEMAPRITGEADGYGPIALYVGGSDPVQFKDVCYRDQSVRTIDPEHVSSNFRLQKLEEFYYAWGAAVGDINHDGHLDIVAGQYYYLGPDFTKRREYYLADTTSPGRGYAANMVTHVHDFRGDGWPDILATESRAVVMYVNPKNENRRWKRYPVAPQISSETTVLKDIDGDGRPELVYTFQNTMMYAKYDPADPTAPWTTHKISEPGVGYVHGVGVGDITGNGHPDILGAAGWWENPGPGHTDELWKYHPVAFGRWGRSQTAGGGEMFVYDVNGDGLNDVVTSLHGHGWGLAWYEQKRDAGGNISFVQHMIMDNYATKNAGGVTFAELHGLTVADLDGDGVPDIITGKRYWSHNDSYFDPNSYGPPVLYWYRTVRDKSAPGGARFEPELIHNRSGVGSQLVAADLRKNGSMDIITGTTRGTMIFWGQQKKTAKT